MSNIFTIALTIFYILWLSAVLVFLWLIWRSSTTHARRIEKTLIDVAVSDAESARKAVETAQTALTMIQKNQK